MNTSAILQISNRKKMAQIMKSEADEIRLPL